MLLPRFHNKMKRYRVGSSVFLGRATPRILHMLIIVVLDNVSFAWRHVLFLMQVSCRKSTNKGQTALCVIR